MTKSIGIVGLGRVGMVAAEKFIKTGYQVFGYARRPEVIAKFQKLGGVHMESHSGGDISRFDRHLHEYD